MSTKSKPKKSSSKKQGRQKAEKPVELGVDAEGVHNLTEKATATSKQKKAKPVPDAAPQTPDNAEALVVFAFRLTEAERDSIHKAAGPAKASRFVRTLAVAAARNDQEAVKEILKSVQA